MVLETVAAVALGTFVLWLLLAPLFQPAARSEPAFLEPLDPEETRQGVALIALKEIDFDRATGKLSEADYEALKVKYTAEAVTALREEETADAVEALIAGRVRTMTEGGPARFCTECGTAREPEQRFCSECGTPVAV